MKAEERHRLKTNALAQALSDLPEYFQKHGSKIITVVLVVLVLVVAAIYAQRYFVHSNIQQRDDLFEQLIEASRIHYEALARAQTAEQTTPDLPVTYLPYDAKPITAALAGISAEAPDKPVGMTARLLQAQLTLSNLHFSDQPITQDEKNQICQTAEGIFTQLLQEYPNVPFVVGSAKIGLATIAEEHGQWDQARQLYDEVIALQDDLLVGTHYPKLAQRRLGLIDTVSNPIEFPEVAPLILPETDTPPFDPLLDLTNLPPYDPNLTTFDPNQPLTPPAETIPLPEPNKVPLPTTDPNIIK